MIVLSFALAVAVAGAQKELPCDPTAIRWVLPGEFSTAFQKSQEQKRLIAIKGIAFGVDEKGAKCATEGCW